MKRFSQNASHELKSPLVLITSELEQLRSKVKGDSLSKGFFHIQNEIERMAKIIDSLLNLMKIDSNQLLISDRPLIGGGVLTPIPAAAVILAIGMQSVVAFEREDLPEGAEYHRVGDGRNPGNAFQAIHQAFELAITI